MNNLGMKFDFNNMMSPYVADGVTEEEISGLLPEIEKAFKAMAEKRAGGKMDWRDLPYNQDNVVDDIINYAESVKNDFEAFVVLGIGGSALGPLAVQQAINHPYYNELPREKRGGYPKFYVADNVDPEKLACLFEAVDPTKCLFNCVSKSGSTSETMSQFMIIKELLSEKLPKDEAAKHIVCTTDKEKGNLIKIAKEEGYKTFIIPSGVGGRFSELTPVGLLPAAMCGIDIKKMLQGAAEMDKLCSESDIYKNPAAMYAVLSYVAMKKGKNKGSQQNRRPEIRKKRPQPLINQAAHQKLLQNRSCHHTRHNLRNDAPAIHSRRHRLISGKQTGQRGQANQAVEAPGQKDSSQNRK